MQSFQIGELIKWYEVYANGDLVKDAGMGVIIQIANINAFEAFKIFRIKRNDIVTLNDYEIEKLNRSKK
tara:strand:+ start:2148 stop:2354 length:207 start_codon:yes stop_codon:yes gene_type:complete